QGELAPVGPRQRAERDPALPRLPVDIRHPHRSPRAPGLQAALGPDALVEVVGLGAQIVEPDQLAQGAPIRRRRRSHLEVVAHRIASSSTSKTSGPVGAPVDDGLSPYASAPGIQKRTLSPTTISCTPSVHPLITPFNGKLVGWPRCTELSNRRPSGVQPL